MSSLVLNASYEPLTFVNVQRALKLVVTGKAMVIESDEAKTFRSESLEIAYPKVIRLMVFVEIPRQIRKRVSRKMVMARDKYTCQYCGRHRSSFRKRERLTIEHVKPKSKGGKTTWDNIVAACNTCNARKGGKLPYEVHMYPKHPPREPRYLAVVLLEKADDSQRVWIEKWC